jgi:hypothetical protein
LTGSDTNHVYISFDPTADDSISYTINTTDTPPSDPHLKVGEVDTANDATTELNRSPPGEFDDVEIAGRRIDSDGDGIFENSDVDALTSLEQDDSFSAYPLTDGDYRQVTSIDSANTTSHLTNDENEVRVDPSSAAVTVSLDSDDASDGNTIRIWDAGRASSTNAITIDTEGTETFADGSSSKTISTDGAFLTVQWDATLGVWLTDRTVQRETVQSNTLRSDSVQTGSIDNDGSPVAFGDTVNLSAHATGQTTIAAGGDVLLNQSTDYETDYYQVFYTAVGSTSDAGAAETYINVTGDGNVEFRAVEKFGSNAITINWAIVKIAEQ